MSLLMEALKKAERAKKGQAIPPEPDSALSTDGAGSPDAHNVSTSTSTPGTEMELLPHEQAKTAHGAWLNSDFPQIIAPHNIPDTPDPIQRPELEPALSPEARDNANPVTPTLELAAYDLTSQAHATKPEPVAKPSIKTESPAQNPEPHKIHTQENANVGAAQKKAKAIFVSKHPAPSRKKLFISAATVMLVFAGTGLYFYWQTTHFQSSIAPFSPTQQAIAPTPLAPSPPLSAQINAADSTPAMTGIAPQQPNSPSSASPSARSKPALTAERPSQPAVTPAIQIRQSAATSQINPSLAAAYQSLLSGNMEMAQQQYRSALQQEPNSRDALLGLAAVALNRHQPAQATAYYARLMELDPADPDAMAGLVGLQGQIDPVQGESRLKKILAQHPNAGALHFALGNLYMQQSRWAEAQQSYFRAYSSTPNNADYAFNLAVSLDHLSQNKLALDYYQRAIAQSGPANFDKSSVQTRIKELLQTAGN